MADSVGFVCHPGVDTERVELRDARSRLEQRGLKVWTHCATRDEKPGVLASKLDGTRLLVSFGGDGTLLWTAQQAAVARVPVLGVNAGRLGFLTEVQMAELPSAIDRWGSGDFRVEDRPLLEAQVRPSGRRFMALNDAVVDKGMQFTLVRVEASIDGEPAGRFDADGAVVATTTGSTGYALSLGGPIVHPSLPCLIFLPLNPHSLFNRPLVLPQTARITLRLPDVSGVLVCDGQLSAELDSNDEVEIGASKTMVSLIRFGPERNFFTVLRQKIRWGIPLTDGDLP
jgi:NAD+ kinase